MIPYGKILYRISNKRKEDIESMVVQEMRSNMGEKPLERKDIRSTK